MSCPFCDHANPAGSAFCESCGGRQASVCPACGAESRTSARFCRGCGNPLAAPDEERADEQTDGVLPGTSSAPARAPAARPVLPSSHGVDRRSAAAPRRPATLMGMRQDKAAETNSPLWAADRPGDRIDLPGQRGGPRPQFEGRQAELEQLADGLGRARGGAATLIEINGDPGAGKTRLVEEFRAGAAEDDPWWFELTVEESQRRAPLQLATDLLLTMLGPSVSAPDAAILAGALRQVLPEQDCSGLARALAGYLRPAGPQDTMEPGFRRRLITHALRSVLEALTRRRPVGLVLDNLHLADISSLEVLHEIMPTLARARLLLIAIAQRRFTPPWDAEAMAVKLPLGGLAEAEASPLIERLAGGPIEAGTIAFLLERTAGNPLFLETLVRMLLRESYLEPEEGAQRLPARRYGLIPNSLEELYQLQIERLGENVRLALGPAVVLGETFTLRQLSELVRTERTWAVPDTLLTGNLDHLLQSELIEALDAAGAYRFRHGVIRTVAATGSPSLRASRLHTLLGRLLEQEATPWTGRRLQRLAFHFGLGDRAVKGIEYHARAGEHALSVHAFPEAEAHYLAGMERLADAGSSQERTTLVESLTAGLARARSGLGQYEAAEAGFRAALAASDDPLVRSNVLSSLATVLASQWRHQDALFELGQEDDLQQTASGEPGVLAALRLKLRRLELLRELGWYADAEETAMEALATAGAYDPRFDTRIAPLLQESVARLCAILGEIKIVRRDLHSAADVLERSRSIAEGLADRRCLAEVNEQLARLAWLQGDLDAAADCYRRARDLQLETGDLRGAALATHNLGLVFWRQSRVSDAEAHLLEALSGLELAGELDSCRAALANLERVYWYRGDFERLETLHAKEQALAEQAGWNLDRENLLFSGRLAFERGDLANAEASLRAVLAASETAHDETALEATLALGETLRSGQRLVEAAEVLTHGLDLAVGRRDPIAQGLAHLGLAEVAYCRADYAAAAQSAAAAAALAGAPDQRMRLGARHLLGRYYRLTALVAARAEQWDEADAAFRQSLELLESMEAYLEAARTRVAWAETLVAAQRKRPPADAAAAKSGTRIRTLLADALDTFRNAGLAPEQEQIQAALAQL